MAKKKYIKVRKKIPAVVQRKVKVESNHSCLVCKERVSLQLHHIDGNRDNNKSENIIYICSNCHGMAHDGKISAMDLREYKKNAVQIDDNFAKFQKSISFLLGSPEISVSKNFVSMKLKYHEKLIAFADKLIFYQCFIYLIPEFYIDGRGESVRSIVRELLDISSEEEQSILSGLKQIDAINVTSELVSLKDSSDAKTALNELINSGKLDIQKVIEKFSKL